MVIWRLASADFDSKRCCLPGDKSSASINFLFPRSCNVGTIETKRKSPFEESLYLNGDRNTCEWGPKLYADTLDSDRKHIFQILKSLHVWRSDVGSEFHLHVPSEYVKSLGKRNKEMRDSLIDNLYFGRDRVNAPDPQTCHPFSQSHMS